MSEEFPLQVTPGRSLSLLKTRSGLIARGLRDAAELVTQNDPLLSTRRLAEQGDADAQYELGEAYYKGRSVPRDYAVAHVWVRKAADQLHPYAIFDLGEMYERGEGVPADQTEAAHYYLRAADIAILGGWDEDWVLGAVRQGATYGHADAQFQLGCCYTSDGSMLLQDHTEAVKWYRKAADQGHASAQHNLGMAYYYGKGVAQDFREAAKWVRRAAEQGNEAAMFALGYMYQAGQGLLQDHAQAAGWFRQAAERGNASAQASLGAIYRDGQGVPQDYVQAHMWFNLSASVSSGDEQTRLSAEREAVAARLAPDRIAEAQALAREWKRRATM